MLILADCLRPIFTPLSDWPLWFISRMLNPFSIGAMCEYDPESDRPFHRPRVNPSHLSPHALTPHGLADYSPRIAATACGPETHPPLTALFYAPPLPPLLSSLPEFSLEPTKPPQRPSSRHSRTTMCAGTSSTPRSSTSIRCTEIYRSLSLI